MDFSNYFSISATSSCNFVSYYTAYESDYGRHFLAIYFNFFIRKTFYSFSAFIEFNGLRSWWDTETFIIDKRSFFAFS